MAPPWLWKFSKVHILLPGDGPAQGHLLQPIPPKVAIASQSLRSSVVRRPRPRLRRSSHHCGVPACGVRDRDHSYQGGHRRPAAGEGQPRPGGSATSATAQHPRNRAIQIQVRSFLLILLFFLPNSSICNVQAIQILQILF
jgi:hypothetical protein